MHGLVLCRVKELCYGCYSLVFLLCRFLRMRNFDMSKAEIMFVNMLKWRDSSGVDLIANVIYSWHFFSLCVTSGHFNSTPHGFCFYEADFDTNMIKQNNYFHPISIIIFRSRSFSLQTLNQMTDCLQPDKCNFRDCWLTGTLQIWHLSLNLYYWSKQYLHLLLSALNFCLCFFLGTI